MTESPLLTEWREQEGPDRRYPFAAPEGERCEAVTRAQSAPWRRDPSDLLLYRCGKRRGHDGRHASSDAGAWTIKWDSYAHQCCMCPQQDPPLPCCNAGHQETTTTGIVSDGT